MFQVSCTSEAFWNFESKGCFSLLIENSFIRHSSKISMLEVTLSYNCFIRMNSGKYYKENYDDFCVQWKNEYKS